MHPLPSWLLPQGHKDEAGGHSRPESTARYQTDLGCSTGHPPFFCFRKSPRVSLLLGVAKGQVHNADPPFPQRWGLEMTPQVGEVILCTSTLPTHTVFPLVPSPACTSLLTVSKNNVFMPSTFCEPSAGNSDSEPGEPSRPFTFLGWSLGVSWDEKQGLNWEWVV